MKTLNIHNVVTGNKTEIEIPVKYEENYFEYLNTKLKEEGLFSIKNQLIISEIPIEHFQSIDISQLSKTIISDTEIPAPPIPRTDNPLSILPSQSEELIVSKNLVTITNLYIDGTYMSIKEIESITPITPPFPKEVYLQFSTYWKQVGAAAITGDQDYSKSVAFTSGMSKTDSTTFSTQLGIGIQGLSASISSTVGHSITISEETIIEDTYDIKVPKEKTTVYALWQLIQKYVFVDASGKPIDWEGGIVMFGGMSLIKIYFPNAPRYNESNIVYSDRMNFDFQKSN